MAVEKGKIQKLTKNIGLLSNYTNTGVINTSKGLYLLDPGGTDESGLQIMDAIDEECPGKDISGIFLTHAHTDHCGGVPAIIDRFQSTIYSSKTTANFIEIPESIAMIYSGSRPGKEMGAREFLLDVPITTDIILANGQEIDLGEVSVSAIDLPGHCPGMMGFVVHDKEDGKKAFFLGDAFFGMKTLKKIWIPFILNPMEFRNSIELIERTPADLYIPGHGEVCSIDIAGCVAEHNIMITYELEDLILKLIGSGCNEISHIIEATANYAGMKLKSVNYYLILCTIKSYISTLEEEGKIENYMESNRLLWRLKK